MIKENADTVNIRIGRDKVDLIRKVAARHPLKPTLRAAIERAIELKPGTRPVIDAGTIRVREV